jgi:hypothetical protein
VSKTNHIPVAAAVPLLSSTPALKAPADDLAPLTVLHIFWRCSVSGREHCLPMLIDALIDHGSHLVLISNELVNSLQLKRQKLHEPLSVEMAMAEGGKKDVVELRQWVKLRLYDESGVWTSKTVRAVIAPSSVRL